MNQASLENALAGLPIRQVRYFASIGSTNDEALVWAAQGAPDLSVVAADEQTAGRGRGGRRWFTPPGSALAFSVVLRTDTAAAVNPPHSRTVGLAALAVAESLRTRGLVPQIKWPNDILIAGRKVGGILVESVWIGQQVDFAVVGIGLNVTRAAVPSAELLTFPAASLEEISGTLLEREALLRDILEGIIRWRGQMGTDSFLKAWEDALAFRGQQVQVWEGEQEVEAGQLLGLDAEGRLKLRDAGGNIRILSVGDLRLRPASSQ